MTSISAVSSGSAMAELVKAQSEQLAEVMKAATGANIELAEKLVRLSAEAQVEAAKHATVAQILDLYI